jgi:dTDP-4-amino-4,6-dideoxygalactose transaminase
MSKLALLGGAKAVKTDPADTFKWPIVNREMEDAVVKVLRDGSMSGHEITRAFERGFADWHGMMYAVGCNNGTAALHTAMFALGIGPGDEIICPSITIWASCQPALSLGATVAFADIDPTTLCVDPIDIERRITERTKAIVVVHYLGMPCDMDAITAIARKHDLKIIEDVSHAHGGLYKGRMVGTFGDVSCFSLMSGKSFAIGEAGILLTNDRLVRDRALLFGFYARHHEIEDETLKNSALGVPAGGCKYRMHQMSSAVGLVQLKKYPGEMAEIDRAMNTFWDLLEGVPGIRAHRPLKSSGSTMGGWYAAHGLYVSDELDGLSISRFCEAVQAEGAFCKPGCNKALHLHPRFAQARRRLHVSEGIQSKTYFVPWFCRFRREIIEENAAAFRKVAENYRDLLPGDQGEDAAIGAWSLSAARAG